MSSEKESEYSLLTPSTTSYTDDFKSYSIEAFQVSPEVHNLEDEDKAEINLIDKSNRFLREGNEYFNYFYGARGLSNCLIQCKGDEDTNEKERINLINFKLLLPTMQKISDLSKFAIRLITFITENFMSHFIDINEKTGKSKKLKILSSREIKSKKGRLNPTMLVHFSKLIDLVIRLDLMKDIKASLLNDYSAFKRCFHLCKGVISSSDLEVKFSEDTQTTNFGGLDEPGTVLETIIGKEMYKLQVFLADPSGPKFKILSLLRDKIYKTGKFGKDDDEVRKINKFLAQALCAMKDRAICNDINLVPEEKYRMLRSIPTIMLLIDSGKDYSFFQKLDVSSQYNIFRNKAITDDNLMIVLEKYPVVPLAYDMVFNMFYILQACPSYSVEKESNIFFQSLIDLQGRLESKNSNPKLRLQYQIEGIKENFIKYSKKLQDFLMDTKDLENDKAFATENVFKCTKLVLTGFKYLSQWKESLDISHCLHLFSANSVNDLLKKSYSEEGIYSVAILVAYMKTVKSIMTKSIDFIQTCLKSFIYNEVRKFPTVLLDKLIALFTPAKTRKTFTFRRGDSGNVTICNHLLVYKEYFAKFLRTKIVDLCDLTVLSVLGEKLLYLDLESVNFAQNTGTLRHKIGTITRTPTTKIPTSDIDAIDKFINRLVLSVHFNKVEQYLQNVTNCSHLVLNEFHLALQKFDVQGCNRCINTEILTQCESSLEVKSLFAFDVFNDAHNEAINVLKRNYLAKEIKVMKHNAIIQLNERLSKNMLGFFKFEASHSLLFHYKALPQKSKDTGKTTSQKQKDGKKKYIADQLNPGVIMFRGDWSQVGLKNFSKIKNRIITILKVQKLSILGKDFEFNKKLNTCLTENIELNIFNWLQRFNKIGVFDFWMLSNELSILEKAVSSLRAHIDIPDFDSFLNRISHNKDLIQKRVTSELLGKVIPKYSFDNSTCTFESSYREKGIDFPRATFSAELVGSEKLSIQLNQLLVSRDVSVMCSEVLTLLANSEIIDVPKLSDELGTVVKRMTKDLKRFLFALHENMPSFQAFRHNSSSDVVLLTLKTILEGWLKNERTSKLLFNFSKLLECIGNATAIVCKLSQLRSQKTDGQPNWIKSYLVSLNSTYKDILLGIEVGSESKEDDLSAFPLAFGRITTILKLVISLKNEFETSADISEKLLNNFGDGISYGISLIRHFMGAGNCDADFVSHFLNLRESEELFNLDEENEFNLINQNIIKKKRMNAKSESKFESRNNAVEYLHKCRDLESVVLGQFHQEFSAKVTRIAYYSPPEQVLGVSFDENIQEIELQEENGSLVSMIAEDTDFCV